MTGKELFDAMGQIDEEYIQEATELPQRKPFPMFRYAGIAACLCLLLAGLMLWPGEQSRQNAGMPAGIQASQTPVQTEAVDGNSGISLEAPDYAWEGTCEPEQSYGQTGASTESNCPAQAMEPDEEEHPQENPSVILQVLSWTDEGMLATVHEQVDTNLIPVGTQLKVIFAWGNAMADGAMEITLRGQEHFSEGSLIRVQFYSYEDGCIYVDTVQPVF